MDGPFPPALKCHKAVVLNATFDEEPSTPSPHIGPEETSEYFIGIAITIDQLVKLIPNCGDNTKER